LNILVQHPGRQFKAIEGRRTLFTTALATGCIRQSKSPLEAPVFFIKKKDGKLCFVQDYRALNARKNSICKGK
jgi:hypothetical protein